MIPLTEKAKKLYSFIKIFQDENEGLSPSFDEMMVAMGLKSKSGVHRLIHQLEERGWIKKLYGRARAIKILDGEDEFDPIESALQTLAVAERFTNDQARRISLINIHAARSINGGEA